MLPPIEDFGKYVATLPIAGPGDYQSHQEFANTLIGKLVAAGSKNASYDQVCSFIKSLVRREKWYEMAVLRDLLIIDHKHRFNSQLVKCWLVESFALQEQKPPYHVLIAMAYEWLKTDNEKYRIFLPGDLPDVSERPPPPKPDWMTFFESKPPAGGRPLVEYFDQVLVFLGEHEGDCQLAYYNYYMATHEPNMIWYNVPILHDLCKNDSDSERESRLLRYQQIALDEANAYKRFHEQMLNNIEEAYARGTEVIAAGKKKQTMSELIERLKKQRPGRM